MLDELLKNIDWTQIVILLWTAIGLPILTNIGMQINEYAKAKKIDKYTDMLYNNMIAAVKDVYETTVKDIKGTDIWTEEKQYEVKEIAKIKAINALTNSALQALKIANTDFEQYLDSLVETALYDIKRGE